MKKLLIIVCFLCQFGFFALPAHAILFDGKMVSVEYLWPDINTQLKDDGNAVVGAGVEFTMLSDVPITLDISDTQLRSTFGFSGGFNDELFNGYHISDINNTIDPFTSVSIDPLINMVGFDLSRVTFDADNIWVNWQGLQSIDTNTLCLLDVNVPVPEPGTMMLLGIGMAALAIYGKRRANKSEA